MTENVDLFPGFVVPAAGYRAAPPRHTSRAAPAVIWILGIAVIAAALVTVSARISTAPARYVCPPDCGSPPTGTPVTTNPRHTSADGAFSVAYPAPGSAYQVQREPNGVTAQFVAGDGGTLRLFGVPAHGRSAEQIAKQVVREAFPDTRTAYVIPNAMVGYQPGYGEVADCWPQGANSSYLRMRILVMVAIKHDLALVAAAVGPYRQFGPDFGIGKPSGANTQIALDMGKYVNSFRWRDDPPR
ncbi:MAG: hypothetical protein DIU75_002425 [Mycolicibacterium hassiacum]|jgi:hypothetical protein|uniref:hypothetical protein n=1 Tax=Mycolicibacterium hassiacum TaxID=46351 RepID=UPI000DB88D79|nr:hypothetical protein [Mycolicibacterium hassiacum]MBX5489017.1 hypothetical protein [Mycolicibacterium hassiacum]PZN23864.1 MAG: hypothetical protein DIU75_04345 [Mycolicibacterium hassiacum]